MVVMVVMVLVLISISIRMALGRSSQGTSRQVTGIRPIILDTIAYREFGSLNVSSDNIHCIL
jgi:hypothetical protein